MYQPQPVDTSQVQLPISLQSLIEELSANNHDVWARGRIGDGWTLGPQRDDATKQHPCLVPYDELSESEKQYDRNTVVETLKAIIALGYRIDSAR